MNYYWKLKNTTIIDKALSKDKFIDILLANRQLNTLDSSLPKNPLKLKKAVIRIQKAIKLKEPILIYGDYDVDGITATAILWQALKKAGAIVLPFVPHREIDGYGFKAKSFLRFQKEKNINFKLLITVDNGIVAGKEFAKVNCDVVVTDHHVAPETLPNVSAIVHSTALSGAGIAFFLAKEFDKSADIGLAALGTIADCLPLTGLNRSLVIHGLQKINCDPSIGLSSLIIKKPIGTYDLSFLIAPRLNAAGRLSDPTDSLRLLCSTTKDQAKTYCDILECHNKNRQDMQEESIKIADKQANIYDKTIFISNKKFHPGVIGLIAGRLTEKYYLPSIIISETKDICKGSCRSIKELNIIEALRLCEDLLLDLGGHAQAAGFSVEQKNLKKFQNKITKIINLKLENSDLKPTIDIDAQMDLNAVTLNNCKIISELEPFGIGNPKPLFLFKDVQVSDKRLLGAEKNHLKLRFQNIDAIGFKMGDLYDQIGKTIDLVASLDINTYNNYTSPQLVIKSIHVKNSN